MAEAARRCENEACACPVEAGEHHCGSYCANVARGVEEPSEKLGGEMGEMKMPGACSCGHAPCRESQRVPPAEDEGTTATGPGPGEFHRGRGAAERAGGRR